MDKPSNVAKNDEVKKTEYNKLVTKVNGIDTTKFVSRTKYEKDGSDLEKKSSDVDKKITDHNYDKYITTQELNRLTTENFKARLAEENFITKTDLDTELKKNCDRVTSNKTKLFLSKMNKKN